jgi:predicted amidophosphoribosyltransferase
MNPLVLYMIFVGVAVVVALSAMVMARPMVRCCPGCDGDVRLDASACRACGYRFA